MAAPPVANSGLQANTAGALAYLAGIITGIIFLVIDPYKSDRFVRFHAFQSIFFNVAWIALWIAWMIVRAGAERGHQGAFLFPSVAHRFVAYGRRVCVVGVSYVQRISGQDDETAHNRRAGGKAGGRLVRACEKRWLLERTRGTPRTYVLGNFQPSLRDFSFGSDLTQDLPSWATLSRPFGTGHDTT